LHSENINFLKIITLISTSKEKQNLEEKLKESKTYINKLEQRILQSSKGVTNQQGTGISTIGTIPTEYEGQDVTIHKLKEIIDNQQYEIKLLTQTLVDFLGINNELN